MKCEPVIDGVTLSSGSLLSMSYEAVSNRETDKAMDDGPYSDDYDPSLVIQFEVDCKVGGIKSALDAAWAADRMADVGVTDPFGAAWTGLLWDEYTPKQQKNGLDQYSFVNVFTKNGWTPGAGGWPAAPNVQVRFPEKNTAKSVTDAAADGSFATWYMSPAKRSFSLTFLQLGYTDAFGLFQMLAGMFYEASVTVPVPQVGDVDCYVDQNRIKMTANLGAKARTFNVGPVLFTETVNGAGVVF
jgi:hypothetical protein